MSAGLRAAVLGLLAGVALDALTVWVARAGPAGDGWSFRGNGALVVPLGLGPAALAGAWSAAALYARAHWLRFAVLATLIGATPAVASVLVLVLFGPAAQKLSDGLTLPALAWPVVAIVASVIARRLGPQQSLLAPPVAVAAALTFTIALAIGFLMAQLVLPPGS